MKQEHIKSYYTINGLCLFSVCVILTSDLPLVRYKYISIDSAGIAVESNNPYPEEASEIWEEVFDNNWYFNSGLTLKCHREQFLQNFLSLPLKYEFMEIIS